VARAGGAAGAHPFQSPFSCPSALFPCGSVAMAIAWHVLEEQRVRPPSPAFRALFPFNLIAMAMCQGKGPLHGVAVQRITFLEFVRCFARSNW
jgi:hypothetical protein